MGEVINVGSWKTKGLDANEKSFRLLSGSYACHILIEVCLGILSVNALKIFEFFLQACLNNYVNGVTEIKEEWMPDNLEPKSSPVICKLLCGADVLESFNIPDLWTHEDVSLICCSRSHMLD